MRHAAVASLLAAATACKSGDDPACRVDGARVVRRPIATVADLPLMAASPPGDPRLFVAERGGVIQIVDGGKVAPAPFLDVSDIIAVAGDEQGLLGLAFHPAYATNRRFYVYYTTTTDDVIAEYTARTDDASRADPESARVLLAIPDFAANHNGGMLEFGADGLLYASTGDGGGGGDPTEAAQDQSKLLGKILRIDVDRVEPPRAFGIPPTNPFAAAGGAPEVFMVGFRNPWRFSFDRATGDIYIGDVGQERIEEVDVISAADAPGADFGWDDCEGHLDFEGTGCANPRLPRHLPAYEQIRPPAGGTSNWTSVIGGQVYRGACFPDLVGRYFYTDNNDGGMYSFVWDHGVATDVRLTEFGFPFGATFIHEGPGGELYLGYSDNIIYRLDVE